LTAFFALPAVGLSAGQVATTGGATFISSTAATLNGTVDTTYSDSAWAFQYGTTTNYGRTTGPQAVGAGVTAVAKRVSGLQPGTTYHFRLVVQQGYPSGGYALGDDISFTTQSAGGGGGGTTYGRASLTSRTIPVRHKVGSISMRCSGPTGALCQAGVAIAARDRRGRTVACGRGYFTAGAPHTHIVRVRPSRACLTLIRRARHHRLKATFRAAFLTHQAPLTQTVFLQG
jgi:hypothetical protein